MTGLKIFCQNPLGTLTFMCQYFTLFPGLLIIFKFYIVRNPGGGFRNMCQSPLGVFERAVRIPGVARGPPPLGLHIDTCINARVNGLRAYRMF